MGGAIGGPADCGAVQDGASGGGAAGHQAHGRVRLHLHVGHHRPPQGGQHPALKNVRVRRALLLSSWSRGAAALTRTRAGRDADHVQPVARGRRVHVLAAVPLCGRRVGSRVDVGRRPHARDAATLLGVIVFPGLRQPQCHRCAVFVGFAALRLGLSQQQLTTAGKRQMYHLHRHWRAVPLPARVARVQVRPRAQGAHRDWQRPAPGDLGAVSDAIRHPGDWRVLWRHGGQRRPAEPLHCSFAVDHWSRLTRAADAQSRPRREARWRATGGSRKSWWASSWHSTLSKTTSWCAGPTVSASRCPRARRASCSCVRLGRARAACSLADSRARTSD